MMLLRKITEFVLVKLSFEKPNKVPILTRILPWFLVSLLLNKKKCLSNAWYEVRGNNYEAVDIILVLWRGRCYFCVRGGWWWWEQAARQCVRGGKPKAVVWTRSGVWSGCVGEIGTRTRRRTLLLVLQYEQNKKWSAIVKKSWIQINLFI